MSRPFVFLSIGLVLGLVHFAPCIAAEEPMMLDKVAEQKVAEVVSDASIAAAVQQVFESPSDPVKVEKENVQNLSNIDNVAVKAEISNNDESSTKPHVRVARQFFYRPPFFGPPRFYGGGFYGGGGGFYGGGGGFYGGRGFYRRGFYGGRGFGGFYGGGRRFFRRRRFG